MVDYKAPGDSVNMGVGNREMSIKHFRGFKSEQKNDVGSVDLRLIRKGTSLVAQWLDPMLLLQGVRV